MTMERFAAELERKLKVKSMVEKFGVEKASRTQASLEVSTLSKVDKPQTPEEKEHMLKFLYREAGGALM